MSAQPIHHHQPQPRVPRTPDGIAEALSGARRMEFYRELGHAPIDQVEQVLNRWWCEAELDADPEQERIIAAARAGTLPTGTMADVLRLRRDRGAEMPGE
ncbi:hypothetical protein P3T36_001714 [Kitasatospora sp. MAP12-15]|uniref:DUF6247 family protein n=1 Tax=unclassified Kitasatospora TaxID=2633591 RepID=UPI002475316C|nr:hypothetical protein [Kitasatospora sp. MAP12-44]MDH6113407.1 hypothetical protein [Kitasatospora sp. MAP12-44]